MMEKILAWTTLDFFFIIKRTREEKVYMYRKTNKRQISDLFLKKYTVIGAGNDLQIYRIS